MANRKLSIDNFVSSRAPKIENIPAGNQSPEASGTSLASASASTGRSQQTNSDIESTQTQGPAANNATPVTRPFTQAEQNVFIHSGLSRPTVQLLVTVRPDAPLRDILSLAAKATEFASFPLRPAERALFACLNTATKVRWPLSTVSGKVTETWEKAFLVVQCETSGDSWLYLRGMSKPARAILAEDKGRIKAIMERALDCIANIYGERHDAAGLRRALEIKRSVCAGTWEDSAGTGRELMQAPGIGPKKMDLLVNAGVTTMGQLCQMEFFQIERVLKRNPPFGQKLVRELKHFPRLRMEVGFVRWCTDADKAITKPLEARLTLDGIPWIGDGNGRHMALVGLRIWLENKDVPNWGGRPTSVTWGVERPEANGQLQKSTLMCYSAHGGEKLMGAGALRVVPVGLMPGESVFVWASCEFTVGTLIERWVRAPDEGR